MRRIFVVTAIIAVLLTPALARAAVVEFPLVQCGGPTQEPCTPCSLFDALSRVINLVLFGITAPVAAFMIVLSGGMMLLGGANAGNFSAGKTMLTNTLMGVTVILLAWVITNFLIKSLGGGFGDTGSWYEFDCPAFLQNAPRPPLGAPATSKGTPQKPEPVIVQANKSMCSDKAALAASWKANPAQPGVNAPSLTALLSCINRDPVVRELLNTGSNFTWDVNNPLCNLTHGNPVCGACGHGKNSCHNGGRTGAQGAMAVDLHAFKGKSVRYEKATRRLAPTAVAGEDPTKFRTAAGEQGLFDEIYRALVKNNCDYKMLNFEGNHTHMSTKDCDADIDGTRGRAKPID